MDIRFLNKPGKSSLLIYPVFEKGKIADATVRELVKKLHRTKEFEAKEGQTFFTFSKSAKLPGRLVLLGLGKANKLSTGTVMDAFATAFKTAAGHHQGTVSALLLPELFTYAQAIGEALTLAHYRRSLAYKTGEAKQKMEQQAVKTLEVCGITKNDAAQKAFTKGTTLAEYTNDLRDWINAPPNFAHIAFFEEKLREIAKKTGAKLTILKKKELTKLNMGALLGVNRGSPDEARLIVLDYTPKGHDSKEAPLVFVGKGILFDSGGYNLKPSGHIEDMQLDKAGAGTVISLIRMLPELGIKRRVIAVAPFTENLIGERAMKPSEIVTTYSGKTVEVTNTDAEGRLVLADAVAYAVDQFKPALLVDVATLTGACMIALGDRYAGLFGNDDKLMEQLRKAGDETDELLWPLPLHKDHSEKMKGEYADLRNSDTGSSRYAGASKGAAFIKEFVGETKWAHIDIAGPAFTSDPKKYEQKGATGFGLRALVRFVENL